MTESGMRGWAFTEPDERAIVVEQQLDDHWDAIYYVDVVDGLPTVAEISVVPRIEWSADREIRFLQQHEAAKRLMRKSSDRPVRPVSARLLQQLQPHVAIDHVRERLPKAADNDALAALGLTRDALAAEPRRPGRRGRGDGWWAKIAAAYLERVRAGSTSPVTDVAEQLAPTYSRQYVANALQRARRLGILESGRREVGGRLTERGRRALAGA